MIYSDKYQLLFMLNSGSAVRVVYLKTGTTISTHLANHSFSLSNVLVRQLMLGTKSDSVDWHKVLNSGSFPSDGREVRKSLQAAIDRGFVRYVFHILPNTWPSFLPDEKEVIASRPSE